MGERPINLVQKHFYMLGVQKVIIQLSLLGDVELKT